MMALQFTSCMAPNADRTCRSIVEYLGDRLSLPTLFIDTISWQQREQQFDEGKIQVCWICGLPYVWKAGQSHTPIELLVAPVMKGDRYQNRPIYFSDVVVRKDSSFHHFQQLRGTRWAYNEPRSHSGYAITLSHLAEFGETFDFFGEAIEAGAHQTALDWILAGKIDASAIDSTVLETELRRQPQLQSQIRVIATLGSSPAPPWIVSTKVDPILRDRLRSLFLNMHHEPQGQDILDRATIARFAEVCDRDYDPIRVMAQRAKISATALKV